VLRSSGVRALALLVLLSALFGLVVWHGTLDPAPDAWDLPGQEHVATDGDRYVGERVSVEGRTRGTDPVVIAADYGVDSEIRLRVVGLDADVSGQAGDSLRVYGIFEGDRTVRSLNAFVVPTWGAWYTWSISFLSGLWVLGRIVRHWRIDRDPPGLARREQPLTLGSIRGGTDA